MRGKPLKFINKWWQFELGYEIDLLSVSAKLVTSKTTESEMKESRQRMNLLAWIMEKKYSWGIKYSEVTYNYNVSTNALTAFSFSEDIAMLGLAFKYNRYRFDLDYGIKLKIKEEQPFRDQLSNSLIASVEGSYCQTRKMFFGNIVIPCYSLSAFQSNNKANFDPAYGSPTDSVELKRMTAALSLTLHFGEDFMR